MAHHPVDFSVQVLRSNLQWIQQADGKVGPNLAIATAMFGILAAIVPAAAGAPVIFFIAAGVAAICLAGTMWSMALAVFPRQRIHGGSLVFFDGIAELECEKYVERLDNADSDELFDDLSHVIYHCAAMAQIKFLHVRRGMAFLFLSVVPWLVTLSLYYSPKG